MIGPLPDRNTFLRAFAIILLFTVYQSGALFYGDAPFKSSDQTINSVMVMKTLHPELYPRDYIFKDDSLFSFYTPSFLKLIGWAYRTTGDIITAYLVYLPVIGLMFLTGMFLLAHRLIQHAPTALVFTLLVSIQRYTIGGTFWGVFHGNTVMPRTLFMALVPWLFLVLIQYYRDRSLWRLPLLGFAGGLAANLHPISGMMFVELLLLMVAVQPPWDRRWLSLLLLIALASVAGVWPFLINYVQHTEIGAVTIVFERFREALLYRMGYMIFPFENMTFLGESLAGPGQRLFIYLYLLAMAPWLALFIQRWRRGENPERSGWFFALLLLIQMPMAYWILNFNNIALVVAAFISGLVLMRGGVRPWMWFPAVLLVGVIFCTLVLAWFFHQLWEWTHILSLTAFMVEQARAAKYVPLPLFLLVALALREILAKRPARWVWPVVVILLVLSVYSVRKDIIPRPWKSPKPEVVLQNQHARELYRWAREETAIDSVFYYDRMPMRLFGRRAITHEKKDLGLAHDSQSRLVALYDRHKRVERGYAEPERMPALAAELGVDYIVVETWRKLEFPLPVAFANGHYRVYDARQWRTPS